MKIILILVALLSSLFLTAAPADTVHVITHNKQTIVTNPVAGNSNYSNWGVFPATQTPIRKIILHVKFACPDSMRCADWDYIDFITIKRTGGVNAESKNFEIARMLTPYGGAFAKDWKFNWQVDITDFSLLLRDSVEINYNHTGWEPNHDRGWQVTLDFEIIKGKPIAEPLSIKKIYGGSFLYGDSTRSIEEDLKPFEFKKEKNADYGIIKILQTGHGANPGDGCAEFCDKYREVFFNEQLINKRQMWKECSDNALYPQAGTWVFDRANWCPGYLQIPDDYLVKLQENNTVDINMEPYIAKTRSEASENITAYIIQYKKPVANNDAALLEIINPSDKNLLQRFSSAANKPSVVIKNNGSKQLKSLLINYGIKGKKIYSYQWRGTLLPGAKELVQLPDPIECCTNAGKFEVLVSKPNNAVDAFEWDNNMAASIPSYPVHGPKIMVVFKTNKQPQHNSFTISNAKGETLLAKSFDSTQQEKLIKDSVQLPAGVYQFNVKDTANDGLEFWFNNRGGAGYVRLQDEKGNILKQFDADFGCCINYTFEVGANGKILSPINAKPSVSLYPTRTRGTTTLEYYHGTEEDVLVQIITDEGAKLVEEHHYKKLKSGNFTYDLSYRPAQRYYLKVFVNNQLMYNKRIRVEERR